MVTNNNNNNNQVNLEQVCALNIEQSRLLQQKAVLDQLITPELSPSLKAILVNSLTPNLSPLARKFTTAPLTLDACTCTGDRL